MASIMRQQASQGSGLDAIEKSASHMFAALGNVLSSSAVMATEKHVNHTAATSSTGSDGGLKSFGTASKV